MIKNNSKLRHYHCINDYVKLYFDNDKILLVSKTQFAPNFQDFFDLTFEEIRKKYKTFLITESKHQKFSFKMQEEIGC